jgi:hypothetical protein
METPGPGAYQVGGIQKIGGGRFSNANPMSDIDWTISRSKHIPGPGKYPVGGIQKIGGGRFSTAKPKGEIDWIVYRSKDLPGPSEYGTPELVKMEGGVLFGPEDGPMAFTAPRPLTAPQKLKMEADEKLPGPGSYRLVESVGRQVESMKRSPAQVSFGSGTRGQRKKIYMGHGVTTIDSALGEGPGYAYNHLYLPEVLQPYSPSSFIARDRKTIGAGNIDKRIEDVHKRRQKIDKRRMDEKILAAELAAKREQRHQGGQSANLYSWLYPKAKNTPAVRPHTVDKAKEFRRPPSVPIATALRFNQAGLDLDSVPGPKYNVPPPRTAPSPSFSFTQYAKRTVEEVIEHTVRENIPGPGSYPTDFASRMDALTRQRDLTAEDRAVAAEEVAALQAKFEEVREIALKTAKAYKSTIEKDVQAEKKGLTKPEEGRLTDRAREIAKRAVIRTRNDMRKYERELTLCKRRHAKLNAQVRRCQTPSKVYGLDPLHVTNGSVPMATGTRDAADKLHFPGKKLNPATAVSPGPAAYNVIGDPSNVGGGRFSTAFVKDDTEWIMHRSRQVPGPKYVTTNLWKQHVPDSRHRSAPNLMFATAGRDGRAKLYMPGPLNGVLGGDSPGPVNMARSTIGPQILSNYHNSTVPVFSTAKKKPPQIERVPGPGAYKPPHAVYAKRIRDNRQAVIASKLTHIANISAKTAAAKGETKKTSRRRKFY